ncbi:MAG: flagellar basal body P-ring formation chaperone FlgA [Rhodoblastus sp.]
MTIYPGETIRDSMLSEAVFELRDDSQVIRIRGDLIGRTAKRTLFAGKPIGAASVEDPYTIGNGNPVQLIYERPGISISASGLALQAARTGDPIRVRNVESGLVVTGTVTATGTVLVGR